MEARIRVLGVLIAALVCAGIGSGAAIADNGAVTTHFTASYTDPAFGPVVCSGENIFKTAPKAFNKDSETCTILNGYPAGTYTPASLGQVRWCSDSTPPSHSAGLCSTDATEVVTSNGNGTSTVNVVVYY